MLNLIYLITLMLLFIHNDFKLDLTYLKVSFTEENSWFLEELNAEYSFPFDMPIKDLVHFADLKNYNAANVQREFAGKLYRDGQLSGGTLKFHEVKGDMVSCIIYSGVDILSLLDINLPDLPLHNFEVSDLKAHALTVISQGYPDVDYNFPMVHTDKYDPATEEFHDFNKILNKYAGGQFIENSLDTDSNIDNIKNIMQPLPYLSYILKKGFEAAGLVLEGDIVNDADIRKALLFRDGSYYKSLTKDTIAITVANDQWLYQTVINGIPHSFYRKEITVDKKGSYILQGTIFNAVYLDHPLLVRASSLTTSIQIKRASTVINVMGVDNPAVSGAEPDRLHTGTTDVDYNLELEQGDIITITKLEIKRDQVPSITPDYPETVALNLFPIRYKDPAGNPILSLLDINAIDLVKVVPEMSVKDLVNILRKWKNFSFVSNGNVVTMNYIKLNRATAVNLEEFEIEEPLRTFSEERSYELAFTDAAGVEGYTYDSVFVERQGVKIGRYLKRKETVPINVDALPYPVIARNGVTTAYSFDDDSSKLRLIFYRPMPEGGLPVAYNNAGMLMPAIYDTYYKQWLSFRVKSVSYQWAFIISAEKLKEISTQSLAYAYGNYHVFTELEKERVSLLNYAVVAKSESLQ